MSTEIQRNVAAVVVDIEGTVGSLSHVHDVLRPYAHRRLADWVERNWDRDQNAAVFEQIRRLIGSPELDQHGATNALLAWSDDDVKAPPLKTVQALLWAEGFADGSLSGHVYSEVPESLSVWRDAGIARYVYSSGARLAQRAWFAHTNLGDLSPLLDGYFDLTDAGGKRLAESYRRIAAAIGIPAGAVLFLSDVDAELEAAVEAGWQVVGVRRPGDPRGAAVGPHPTVDSLRTIRLRRAVAPTTTRTTGGNEDGRTR